MPDDKILDKLSKIKAQMESEGQLGNEHAAQAFAAKLQELLLRHKLSVADIPGQVISTKPPEIVESWVGSSKDGFEYSRRRQAWSELLASIVARAYSCQILVSATSNGIWFVGTKEDTKIAEFVFVKLWRLADNMAWTANRTYRKKLRDQGRGIGSGGNSGFRQAFLTGFVTRMRQRLEEQRAEILSTVTSTALVPLNKLDQAISTHMEKYKPKPDDKPISHPILGMENMDGYRAGKETANNVDLNQKAIENSNSPNKALKGEKVMNEDLDVIVIDDWQKYLWVLQEHKGPETEMAFSDCPNSYLNCRKRSEPLIEFLKTHGVKFQLVDGYKMRTGGRS